jgi:hypothetical protein
MADKMMRMAGRDYASGQAKAIKTNNTGAIEVAKLDEILSNQKTIINVMNSDKLIFGTYWDKSSNPVMQRTDAAAGLNAAIGIDGEYVVNDFDKMPIFGEIHDVMDEYGNYFVRIPKFYIKKVDGPNFKLVQVSKTRYPGFYLPFVFWDFANNVELDYFDFGKYKGSESADGKLESKPDKFPLINKNIVQFRILATANNDEVNGVTGYQQLDIHAVDVLQTLFTVEFATLHSQSVMPGFTAGNYSDSHVVTIEELSTNRAIVSNATASAFSVGDPISIGTSRGGNQIFYGREITAITVYDAENQAIEFSGDPVDISVGNFVYNTGWKNGFSRNVLATSGAIKSNNGKTPCHYRGIESPWGDIYQFVDGVNFTDHQTWTCENAKLYASNVFADPYKKVSYLNSATNGYVTDLGHDPTHPYAALPISVGGGTTTYYADNYYQTLGARIALFGGSWSSGASAGLFFWYLYFTSSAATVTIGGRLLKKAS